MKLSDLIAHFPVEVEVLRKDGEKDFYQAQNPDDLKKVIREKREEARYILISYQDFAKQTEDYYISRTTFVFVEYPEVDHDHRPQKAQRRTGNLRR